MNNSAETLSLIDESIKTAKELKTEIAVVVIANIKSNVQENDYETHSLKTEFFADSEYEQIIQGLRSNGYYVIFFKSEMEFLTWYTNGGIEQIKKKHIAIYNSASAGKGPGRKALIPAFCNINGLAITSSNPYVVSLCRHKYHFTSLLENLGLPVVPSWYFLKSSQWLLQKKPSAGTKIIAKPTYESASIGVDENSIFDYSDKVDDSLTDFAKRFDQPITVQEFIPGFELEVPIIIDQGKPFAIRPVGLSLGEKKFLGNEFLTYDIVYDDLYGFYDFDIFGDDLNEKLVACAKNTALAIGIDGFGRVDFRVTEKGQYYIMDVSTYPHMTQHSSFWHLFKKLGYEYKDLFALMIGLTAKRYLWGKI